jgi:streptogramin lyase
LQRRDHIPPRWHRSRPGGITVGPGGSLWFTELIAGEIGQLTPAGALTELPLASHSNPEYVTAGPDGALWFTEMAGDRIGRLTPSGALAEFPLPAGHGGVGGYHGPEDILAGPDGNLWFTEIAANKIGRITPTGVVTEFPVPTADSGLDALARGTGDTLWFTEVNAGKIGRITMAGGVTEFPTPSGTPTANPGTPNPGSPLALVAGPDGNLWFTEVKTRKIGRLTPAGSVTEYPLPAGIGPDFPGAGSSPSTAGTGANGIVVGPDGNLWLTEYFNDHIVRIDLHALTSIAS